MGEPSRWVYVLTLELPSDDLTPLALGLMVGLALRDVESSGGTVKQLGPHVSRRVEELALELHRAWYARGEERSKPPPEPPPPPEEGGSGGT
jgi:hypothetical protein